MKQTNELIRKSTVTLSAKEFLEKLGLEASGELQYVLVTPEVKTEDGFGPKTIEAKVDISLKEVIGN